MSIVGQDTSKINSLKKELSKSFVMKDLGLTKKILGIKIFSVRKFVKLWLFEEAYVERILEKFNTSKAKFIYSPLAGHFKLSCEYCPTSEKEK